jgi:hypothetical protein
MVKWFQSRWGAREQLEEKRPLEAQDTTYCVAFA